MPMPPGYTPGPTTLGNWVKLLSDDWYSYTPVLTGTSTNPAGFEPTGSAKIYQRLGDLVVVSAAMYTPSTSGNSVGTGSWRLSLPVQPKHSSGNQAIGFYYLYNSSGITRYLYHGDVSLHSSSQADSTVEFVQSFHESGGNSISVLPSGIALPTNYMIWNAKFFYEAL